MSKRLEVLAAVKALVEAVLPNADVRGLDADDAKPARIGPGGTIIVRAGDPGQPELDISPVAYNYEHEIPLEVGAYESASLTAEQVLDQMLGLIGAAVRADQTLGGLCDYLEARAPVTDDFDAPGAEPGRWADAALVAHYRTTDPLN